MTRRSRTRFAATVALPTPDIKRPLTDLEKSILRGCSVSPISKACSSAWSHGGNGRNKSGNRGTLR